MTRLLTVLISTILPSLLFIIYIILMFIIKTLKDKIFISIPIFAHLLSFCFIFISILFYRPLRMVQTLSYLSLILLITGLISNIIILFSLNPVNKKNKNYVILIIYLIINIIIIIPMHLFYNIGIAGNLM